MLRLFNGDCLEVLKKLEDNSIDSCVCDPPYHLTSIVSRFSKTSKFDKNTTGRRALGGLDGYARLARGFMGKTWDGGDIAFKPDVWIEILRVLKPGGHLLAFGGTRTYHRMTCAIEDAGFEIRDQLGWMYGSGFPKSHNQGNGWGTALKPAWEPIVMARKPIKGTVAKNREKYSTGAINIDESRIGTRWPANFIHDGSNEVQELLKDKSRFFYCTKTSKIEKGKDNNHPTVKPQALMTYLCRLVTPNNGIILDPFMGSGSTGKAALAEGFDFIGIEKEKEYFEIAKKRIKVVDRLPE